MNIFIKLLGFFTPQGNQNLFKDRSIDDVKKFIKILFIDDKELEIVMSIKTEGWHTQYIPDLDSYDNQELRDSHIICLDINGVGNILGCKNGLKLIKGIKEKHPNKKIILYSSERKKHDFFDENRDLADRVIFKDGSVYSFLKPIEELAMALSSWESFVQDMHVKFCIMSGQSININEFDKILRKSVNHKTHSIDHSRLLTIIGMTADIATIISTSFSVFSNFRAN